MPISDYLRATGTLVHKGETGEVYENVGRLTIERAAIRGIDENCWAVLKICADELKLWLNINSIDTGAHVKGSRHYLGRAADINQISLIEDPTPNQATVANPEAVKLVEYLLAGGFHVGEGRPWAAILFGPPRSRWNPTGIDHATHLHVSIGPRKKA